MSNIMKRVCLLVLSVFSGVISLQAFAQSGGYVPPNVHITKPGQGIVARNVKLGLNKSAVLDIEAPVGEIALANPEIADIVVGSSHRLFVVGKEAGQTNAFVFDPYGAPIVNLDIRVEQDLSELSELLDKLLPDSELRVASVNGSVLLSGRVPSLADSDRAMRLSRRFVDEDEKLVNMMTISGKDQVLLKVRIVEMQRSVTKQLGVNLTGNTSFGELTPGRLFEVIGSDGTPVVQEWVNPTRPMDASFSTQNAFSLAGRALGGLAAGIGYSNYVGGALQSSIGTALSALERVGMVRTLAEPNLTAISGESANFLAGGEFPIPVAQDDDGDITVEFKPYGVGLGFTPVVLSEGRISLRVSTEVSELSTQGAFQPETVVGASGGGQPIVVQSISIPALTVRRAETTVELPSGGSMVIAGLIQERTKQSIDAIPGVKDLPILGALFRSRDFQNEDTEMVVIITPYLVDPTDPNKLRTPTDGYKTASDMKTILFGKLNEVYGVNGGKKIKGEWEGPIGYILD